MRGVAVAAEGAVGEDRIRSLIGDQPGKIGDQRLQVPASRRGGISDVRLAQEKNLRHAQGACGGQQFVLANIASVGQGSLALIKAALAVRDAGNLDHQPLVD